MRKWTLPLVLLLAAGCQTGGSGGAREGGADRVAFASCKVNPDNPIKTLSCNLRTIMTDGTGLSDLTREQSNRWDRRLAWSPDAAQVAFSSCRYGEPGNSDTYECSLRVVNADGTNDHVVAPEPQVATRASWSPSGGRLAFLGCAATCGITLADPDGTNLRTLALPGLATRFEELPAWSPDGRQIVFSGRAADSSGWDLYRIGVDGSGLVDLTGKYPELGSETEPAWSPDGTRLVFVSVKPWSSASIWNLYTVYPDGSHLQNLTHQTNVLGATYAAPIWIDGGSRITFESGDVFVMDADGSHMTDLTARLGGRHAFQSPSWSPDGSWFAAAMVGTEDQVLSLFNASGSCRVKLPDNGRRVSWPSWSPVQTQPPVTPADATCLPKPPPGAPITAQAGRIAFMSTRAAYLGDSPGIYVANADGSGRVRVGDTVGDAAAWSPDGTRLALVRAVTRGSYVIFVVDADGSGAIQLTSSTGDSGAPAWSPDGERIAFVDSGGIDVIDADGENRFTLVTGLGVHCGPVWSPGGTRIAFCSADDNIQVAEVPNGHTLQLTHHAPSARRPALAYSPDGTRLLFTWSSSWTTSLQHTDIYVVNADGSGLENLSDTPGVDQDPAWSPDGQWIAFSSDRNDSDTYLSDIYLMKPDGSGLKRLTYSGYIDSSPVWSPDGDYLAFVARRLDANIMVIRADGSAETAVTTNSADDEYPAWQPR